MRVACFQGNHDAEVIPLTTGCRLVLLLPFLDPCLVVSRRLFAPKLFDLELAVVQLLDDDEAFFARKGFPTYSGAGLCNRQYTARRKELDSSALRNLLQGLRARA